jgi:signal transduction histidine kinase
MKAKNQAGRRGRDRGAAAIGQSALDALPGRVALLARNGVVVAVNRAWSAGAERAVPVAAGGNFLEACARADAEGGRFGEIAAGVRAVLRGRRKEFVLEHRLCQREGKGWRRVRVVACVVAGRRGAALVWEEMDGQVWLEGEGVRAVEQERRRIRQELHDGLSQHLTGLKFKASLLAHHLPANIPAATKEAAVVADLVDAATDEVVRLARSLRPVEVGAAELVRALRDLAARVEARRGVQCRAGIPRPVRISAEHAAGAYQFAEAAVGEMLEREGVNRIEISLRKRGVLVRLGVRADGRANQARQAAALQYFARLLDATLTWRTDVRGRTSVACEFCPG